MGSHQRCWIWGRHAVLETLRAGRWPILQLQLSDDLSEQETRIATRLASALDVPVAIRSADALRRLCRSDDHQGHLAMMPPFPFDDAEEILRNHHAPAFFVVLDSIQDPFNFGAILRSADALGADAVFVGAKGQADVTSLVVRTSAGAVNHVRLARVDDVAAWIRRLKEAGVAVVGTSPNANQDVSQLDLRAAVAIVLGNEGIGIRPKILELCDKHVTIRQYGHVGSLNAAVSAGILFYEVCRQRTHDS